GFGVLVLAAVRKLWTNGRFWGSVAAAAAVAVVCVLPVAIPYVQLQRETGFSRSVDAAASFSATWQTYFASSAYAHVWLLRFMRWNDPLFPGFLVIVFAAAGIWSALTRSPRPLGSG